MNKKRFLQGIDTLIMRVSDINLSKEWYQDKLQLTSVWDDPDNKLVVLDTGSPVSLQADKPIVVEQTFDVSPEELWKAITELKQMTQWFFENIPSFQPRAGFETRFVIENEGRIFPHLWKITEVEPFKKITYNWRYDGYAGDSFVSFELFDQGKITKLKLTHTITEDFPPNIPEFTRESCFNGWNYFISKSLVDYLKSGTE
jgi:uncharacterized protein YndB with AHSA1/START domain